MVCRPRTRGSACVHVIWKSFTPIITVPIFHAGEPGPDRIDWMLVVRPIVTELAGEQRRAPARVDQPARTNALLCNIDIYRFPIRPDQLNFGDFRRAQ